MGATIRPANDADYASVAPLAGELGYPTPGEDIRARLRKLAARADHLVLVAEDRGAVVGWLHAARRLSLEAGEYAEIGGMVVAASHRSRGIGESLVRAAEAWAGGQGLPLLRVRSNVVRQRAHAFYERLGFAATKSQKVFQKSLPSR